MTAFTVDPSRSDIAFSVRHMVFARVRGRFTRWTAELSLDLDDPTRSSFVALIDAGSVDTGEAERDERLRGADFFDARRYPHITFASRKVECAGVRTYQVVGELMIRDVTRSVTLHVEEIGRGKDPSGSDRIAFVARAAVDRPDLGLTWHQALETGGLLVGERVDVEVDLQAITAPPHAA